jgi:hypothetical protein
VSRKYLGPLAGGGTLALDSEDVFPAFPSFVKVVPQRKKNRKATFQFFYHNYQNQ